MTLAAADKVLTLDRLLEKLGPLRAAGKTVALGNGLFDLIHVGHLRYLEGASREADVLVVGVNADSTARALKGPSRPVIPETERAELVAGFGCVDWVTIFSDMDVGPLLRAIRPCVHCKGTDYTVETVPEREIARELGIRTVIVGDPKTHASRELIQRIRSGQG